MAETQTTSDVLPHFPTQTNDNIINKEDSYLINSELHSEARKQELQISSLAENLFPDSDRSPGQTFRHHNHKSFLFCAKELSLSITASESTRIICSISIALVVVLSFIDEPLIGINFVNSKSIVAIRPLYMLLVTEFTILIAYLVVERRRRIEEDSEESSKVSNESRLNWERAVRVMERGIVAHQMIRAIFIDFSVYVVIVVCVLSLGVATN